MKNTSKIEMRIDTLAYEACRSWNCSFYTSMATWHTGRLVGFNHALEILNSSDDIAEASKRLENLLISCMDACEKTFKEWREQDGQTQSDHPGHAEDR